MHQGVFGAPAGAPTEKGSFESLLQQQSTLTERPQAFASQPRLDTWKSAFDANVFLETDRLLHAGGVDAQASTAGVATAAQEREIRRVLAEVDSDHYRQLGVGRRSSARSIKDRFRALVLQVG
jgi:hypothetical protein